jgi:hypothetical protein
MTPEQQRTAIAEACRILSQDQWGPLYKTALGVVRVCPDYLNDLNAMHEVQNRLTAEQARCYDRELQKIGYRNCLAGAFWLWHFPAKWKAEAFLRTIGKWKEAK